MPEREPHSIRLDPAVYSRFVEWVEETEGKKYGETSKHVENALDEYIDHGQMARVEEKLDMALARLSENQPSHTHKNRSSSTVEKCRAIHRRVTDNHGRVIRDEDLKRAIEDIAGGDPRTLRKYRRMFKQRCLLFKHPNDPVWTPETSKWIGWTESIIDNEPTTRVHDVVEDYGLETDEYLSHAEGMAEETQQQPQTEESR